MPRASVILQVSESVKVTGHASLRIEYLGLRYPSYETMVIVL